MSSLNVPLHTLALRAVDFGGFTFRLSDGQFPRDGFAVAVAKGPELQLDHPPTPDDIDGFLRANAAVIEAGNIVFNGGVCVGAWDASGTWYLDLSIVCETLAEAVALGRANDQRAVYDLGRGAPVAVTWPGLRPLAIELG
jgi:hypothetical protein